MLDFDLTRRAKVKIKYKFPIEYFEENLVFKNRACEAAYKMEGFMYDFLSNPEKTRKLNALARLFWNIKLDAHLKAVPHVTSIRERQEDLKRRATGPLRMAAIEDAEYVANDLIQTIGDEGNDYEFYLIIKLENPKQLWRTLKEYGEMLIKDPVRLINSYAGADDPEIFLNEVEIYKDIEKTVFNIINNYISVQRVDEYQIQRLIRQPFFRAIGEPPIRGEKPDYLNRSRSAEANVWKPKGDIVMKNGQKALRPHQRDILTLTEGDIDIYRKHIEVHQIYNGYEVTSYQSCIVVSEVPDTEFPGGEWIYNLLSSTKFPVDVSIRFHSVDYQKAINRVKEEQKKIEDQNDHTRESNSEVPLNLQESKEEADILEYQLKKSKFPLLYATIILTVAAKDMETLNSRRDEVRRFLGDIQTEVPSGDQWDLFNEVLIGGEQFALDYVQRLAPHVLAGTMIGATQKLGDDTGFYIGITGTLKKPVRLDPWRASQINRAPNMEFVGSQGGGKSFTADLISCIAAKMGAKALIVDPKGDRTDWPKHLKSFEGQVKVTTFTANDRDKGKLDPFNIMRAGATKDNYIERMKEAGNLAMDIGMFLLAAKREDERTNKLLRAVNRVVNKINPAMNKIITELRVMATEAENDDDPIGKNMCKGMADTLNSMKEMAYAGLLFGDGDEEAVSLENQINVLQIQNLVFPSEGTRPEDYTFQEIIGYACLLAISGFVMRFILSDRGILGIFELDETTVFRATPVGKNLVNKIQRMARALNKPGAFMAQSVDDAGDEKVKNNIGYKFIFYSNDDMEIRKQLAFLNLEPTKENMDVIRGLDPSKVGSGICLFQDLEGRTGIVAIDAVFEEYIQAFNTKPENKEYE